MKIKKDVKLQTSGEKTVMKCLHLQDFRSPTTAIEFNDEYGDILQIQLCEFCTDAISFELLKNVLFDVNSHINNLFGTNTGLRSK